MSFRILRDKYFKTVIAFSTYAVTIFIYKTRKQKNTFPKSLTTTEETKFSLICAHSFYNKQFSIVCLRNSNSEIFKLAIYKRAKYFPAVIKPKMSLNVTFFQW